MSQSTFGQVDLTEGGILKPLVVLSAPIVVTNLLQTAYNLADTYWLGQYSTEALAAISFAFPMVFLLISLGMGLAVAGSILVAQHTGADEPREAEYAASQTVTFAIGVSAVVGLVGYPFVGPYLDLLGASPTVLPGATAYMQVIALGLPFMFGFFVFISLMRGVGDTITPMIVMFGTVVLNVALDPFLINGWTLVEAAPLVGTVAFPEMGIQGAAVATVFSRSLAMLVGIAIMASGWRGVRIRARDMIPDLSYLRTILRLGIPASIEGTGRAVSVNLLLVVVGLFSTEVVAGYGIGTRVFSVIFLPAVAVARGVETMTGQNIGAGQPDRAARANYLAAGGLFAVLSAVGVAIFLVPRPIVAVFTDDPAVVDVGTDFLRVTALSFGCIGIMRAFGGGFRGAGKTVIAAIIAVGVLAGVRLPVAAVLAMTPLEETGIWIAFVVSNVVGAVIALGWFSRGTWRDGDARGTGVSDTGDETTAETDAERETDDRFEPIVED
ncbi:MATE family efflux transporter [Halococcoides cellulosivorans]|uniref:MATE family efflux transporter n=1 Tax=Halococcoides cellulosivorans TaxID=1679096 RepID=A0A2R4X198_9EURY|nr:MATE family efflux transporter [Halococcoides cellulosivorans]AWB27561.1 MATE family efflux transporter [Halococcoides cellulosivorans]